MPTLSQIYAEFTQLRELFYNHRHKQYDGSKLLTEQSYVGSVSGGGTAIFLPSGWTASAPGTGNYTITHNFHTTNYVVVGNVVGQNQDFIVMIKEKNDDNFKILLTRADGGAAANAQVDFIVKLK